MSTTRKSIHLAFLFTTLAVGSAVANEVHWVYLHQSTRLDFLQPNEYIQKAVTAVQEKYGGKLVLQGYQIDGPWVLAEAEIEASGSIRVQFTRADKVEYILGKWFPAKREVITVEMARSGDAVRVEQRTIDDSAEFERMRQRENQRLREKKE